MKNTMDFIEEILPGDRISSFIEIDHDAFRLAEARCNSAWRKVHRNSLYWQSLALSIFETWLTTQKPSSTIATSGCSLMDSLLSNVIDAVCNVQIDDFKVCLIPSNQFSNSRIAVPKAVVELPQFTAHLYVVVGIDDELAIGAIRGYLPYKQLVTLTEKLPFNIDWTYLVPVQQWTRNSGELLRTLYSFRSPHDLEVKTTQSASEAVFEVDGQALQNRMLWSLLSWEQNVTLLTQANLLDKIHSSIIQGKNYETINVNQWRENVFSNSWFNPRQELSKLPPFSQTSIRGGYEESSLADGAQILDFGDAGEFILMITLQSVNSDEYEYSVEVLPGQDKSTLPLGLSLMIILEDVRQEKIVIQKDIVRLEGKFSEYYNKQVILEISFGGVTITKAISGNN